MAAEGFDDVRRLDGGDVFLLQVAGRQMAHVYAPSSIAETGAVENLTTWLHRHSVEEVSKVLDETSEANELGIEGEGLFPTGDPRLTFDDCE
ncbi:MAG: hypothetical protein ACPIOQ_55675, partial [Promethearchaeia archaeon]